MTIQKPYRHPYIDAFIETHLNPSYDTPQNGRTFDQIRTIIDHEIRSRRVRDPQGCFYVEKEVTRDTIARFYATPRSVTFLTAPETQKSGSYKQMTPGIRICNEEDRLTRSRVAVLKFTKESNQNAKEIEMLRRFREFDIAPAILEHFKTTTSDSNTNEILIETLYSGGDLEQFEHRNVPALSAERVAFIAYQILRIVKIIHEEGFVHRDIKPSNFLLKDHENDIVKACDLGSLYEPLSPKPQDCPCIGTPMYQSPESALSILVDSKTSNLPPADVWAIGMSIGRLLRNIQIRQLTSTPVPRPTQRQLLERISRIGRPPTISDADLSIAKLAAKCLEPNPDRRPTVQAVLQDRLMMQSLMTGTPFMAAILKELIPINQIYVDLLGIDFERLREEHFGLTKNLFEETKLQIIDASASTTPDFVASLRNRMTVHSSSNEGSSPQSIDRASSPITRIESVSSALPPDTTSDGPTFSPATQAASSFPRRANESSNQAYVAAADLLIERFRRRSARPAINPSDDNQQ